MARKGLGMSQHYVSHEGQQLGPFSLDEIIEQVKTAKLTMLDYIYDKTKEDWVSLMEFSELSERLQAIKPKAPPKASKIESRVEVKSSTSAATKPSSNSNDSQKSNQSPNPSKSSNDHLMTEWYVLKGENKFGPFAFTDVVKMLQQKVVFEFDFAWHPGLNTWKRIADLDAFDPEKISQLKETLMPEIEDVFFRRRHRRVSYGGTILIHDNHSVWKGQGVEISAGGAGVIMENAMIVPGQVLYLHFKPSDGIPPFNAVCEVVSKKYVDGVKDKSAPIRYGLKFTNINQNAQRFLQDWSTQGADAA